MGAKEGGCLFPTSTTNLPLFLPLSLVVISHVLFYVCCLDCDCHSQVGRLKNKEI